MPDISSIPTSSTATQMTIADQLKNIDETVEALTGGDETKRSELFKEVGQIIAGSNIKVSRGDITGSTEVGDKKTSGATSTPALDNPDDLKAVYANLEKLLSYLELDNEERQTEMAKDRIQLQQVTLDSEHEQRMESIEESLEEMASAERAQTASRVFGWLGAIMAVVAAVVLTVCTGGVAAGFAIAGAVVAIASLVMNETGATEKITDALTEEFKAGGDKSSDAKLKAQLTVNLTMLGLSLICSVGSMASGFANSAKTISDTARTVQTVMTVANTAVSTGSLATSGVSTYLNSKAQEAQADVTELQKFIEQLQQRLQESEEELQALLEMIESSLSNISTIVASATDTTSEIAQNIGQMA